MTDPQPQPQPPPLPTVNAPYPRRPVVKPPLLRPRKVRGGVKLTAGDIAAPTAWAAQRWLRLLEQAGEGQRLVEGLEYAQTGQTKRIGYLPGRIEAAVQGRADRPYSTIIAFETISHELWDKVVETMADGALYAAKLLANELPANIEDVFAPLGIKLFPIDPSEMQHSCTCADWRADHGGAVGVVPPLVAGRWCKHVCCVAYLFAQRLATEPFLMFMMRGVEGQELIERLRQRRVVAGAAMGVTPIYTQRIAGVADAPARPLEDSLEHFWDQGAGLDGIDLPMSAPPVSHPILRRLGQSPFPSAPFPLVGLLASCYEVVSEHARRFDESGVEPDPADAEPDAGPEAGDDESSFA